MAYTAGTTAMTAAIGLFYGSSTCYTQMTADKIAAKLEQRFGRPMVDIHNIAEQPIALALHYTHLIMGIPTWDYGELQEDWEEVWDDIAELDLSGKLFSLYGQGDQEGYPEWFLDAMGFLHSALNQCGAKACGYRPTAGFEFEASKALTSDKSHFVGLALDDESEFDLSEQRIEAWLEQIIHEFGLQP
tara:strand:- start:173 stop:736 length:564 start_codon:yes stop_codon:yes gene_type:complete